MASVQNLTSGRLQIFAKGSELGSGRNNYEKLLIANETATIPDDVANSINVQTLVANADLAILSYDTADTAPVGSAELKALVKNGTGVATAGTSTVVAETDVKAGDVVIVQAADAAFAALTDVFVDDANIVDNTSFQIDHSNTTYYNLMIKSMI